MVPAPALLGWLFLSWPAGGGAIQEMKRNFSLHFSFEAKISCVPGCPLTHYVAENGLELPFLLPPVSKT